MTSNQSPDPRDLLKNYFDDLLEPQASPELKPTPRAEVEAYVDPLAKQRQRLQKLLYSRTPSVVPPRVEPEPEAEPEPAPVRVEQPEAPEVIPEPAPDSVGTQDLELAEGLDLKHLEWLDNGRPAWAQERFDVLLFSVSGLTLAVPLIALGQIQPLSDELTPLFGQADWFMGLLPTPRGKIRTVNTAKFVMPERYDESFERTAEYVISIDGLPWGLAVDKVNQPISLDPDDVKWRTERSRRPWLAGTVKEQMCALLDIPRIGQLLVDADRKRPQRS